MADIPDPCQIPPDSAPASGRLRVNRIDLAAREIASGEIEWRTGRVASWRTLGAPDPGLPYLAPGLIDAHVHVESSLLPPAEFARLAVRHGTVGAISDPHEIANVLGVEGVHFMLADAARTPFQFLFGAPSCVPATAFETAGGRLDAKDIAALLNLPGVGYLSEVMNFPGVLGGDAEVAAKIGIARARGCPIDGHAPGLRGAAAAQYAQAGIRSDHECVSLDEAEDKLRAGMSILIREGSAARNFEALHPLISAFPGRVMFCTDDCHPDDLSRGHIDRLVARAVAHGHDVFAVLRAACLAPQEHYGWKLGLLAPGDPMNAVMFADLAGFAVIGTWLSGRLVAGRGASLLPRAPARPVNRFAARPVDACELRIPAPAGASRSRCRVIAATDGELFTRSLTVELACANGAILPSGDADVLLLAVANRYRPGPPALARTLAFA